MGVIKTGKKIIGKGEGCFIIAEIGLNHNGNYELAKSSVIEAARAGVDAVKFQNFFTEDFLVDRSVLYTYYNKGAKKTEPLFDICKRCEFKKEWIQPLKELCDELEIVFTSTPTSQEGVMDLVDNGVEVIKNGSDYITHLPLLKFMAGKSDVVIISTGMSDRDDIECALQAVRQGGRAEVILLHCVSNYPTADKNVNLRRMLSLREMFRVPVGFSDHTEGLIASVQAVTLGACVVEKHFTLGHDLPGPDHWFSSTPEEMLALVKEIRKAELRMGTPDIKPAECETEVRDQNRVGLVAARNLKKGDILTEDVIVIKKPAKGLLPKDLDICLGKKINKDLKKGSAITQDVLWN